MLPQELQKRNEKAQQLRVIGVDDETYYVESSEGKISYRVTFSDIDKSCTCADFIKNSKKNSDFKCKHLLSVMGCIANNSVVNGNIIEKRMPKLNEKFITSIEGKDFVKYPGLLDLAHQKGIFSIEVEILQIPTKENGNFAICKATVVSKIGEKFSDVGDANQQNCNSKVAKHLLRMASTRAIARALRSYTNVGMTALEELGDLNEVIRNDKPSNKTGTRKKATTKPKTVEKKPGKNKSNDIEAKTEKIDSKPEAPMDYKSKQEESNHQQ